MGGRKETDLLKFGVKTELLLLLKELYYGA